MNAKKNQLRPRLVNRIENYFRDVNPQWVPGTLVEVSRKMKPGITWNGHQPGEKGIIVRKRITYVQGYRCDIVVTAVQFGDGEVDWGLHMEKLEIVKGA